MKKAVLTIAIFLLTSMAAFSQALQPFKPNDADGLKKVAAQAQTDGLTSPKLKLIGTMNGTVPIQGMDVALTVDLQKGTSSAWIYVYTNASGDSSKTYALIKVPLYGFMAVAFPASMINDVLPFNPTVGLDGFSWNSPDAFYTQLTNEANYKQFVLDRPDQKVGMLGLGVNTESPLAELNKAYWLITVNSGGGSLTCFMNAETGVTFCLGYWDVKDEIFKASLPQIAPIPAAGEINLKFPESVKIASSIVNIADINGNVLKSLKLENIQPSSCFTLDLKELPSGEYSLIFISNPGVSALPFIINK